MLIPLLDLPRACAVGSRVRDLRLARRRHAGPCRSFAGGRTVSLRQKLLLLFSLTVAAAVAAVAWTVLVRIRHVFELRDQEETALFVSQFQREFQHRSPEVAAAVDRLAASERARAMAFELAQSGDASPYLTEAQTMAQDAQLDFLEIVGAGRKRRQLGAVAGALRLSRACGCETPRQRHFSSAKTCLTARPLSASSPCAPCGGTPRCG